MRFISKIIQRQQFNPSLLGMVVNPFYFVRHELLKKIRQHSKYISGKVLDVGCGTIPYRQYFDQATQYIGLEYDTPETRRTSKASVFYTGTDFPFEDNSFDSAIATEVLEHIFEPDRFLTEINRVLKSKSYLILTCPFMWDEHSQPIDYARYSSFGVRHTLEAHGFEIVDQYKSVSDLRAIAQMLNCYLYKKIPFRSYSFRLLCYILIISPVTISASIIAKLFPRNPDMYITNIILARKI